MRVLRRKGGGKSVERERGLIERKKDALKRKGVECKEEMEKVKRSKGVCWEEKL